MSQQIIIEVNGISRHTVEKLIEGHGNLTYAYTAEGDETIEITMERVDDKFEVSFESDASFGMMLSHPDLSSAMDHFFDLVKIHPAEQEEEVD